MESQLTYLTLLARSYSSWIPLELRYQPHATLYPLFQYARSLMAYSRTGTAVQLYSMTCFVSRAPPGSFLEHRSEIWDARHMTHARQQKWLLWVRGWPPRPSADQNRDPLSVFLSDIFMGFAYMGHMQHLFVHASWWLFSLFDYMLCKHWGTWATATRFKVFFNHNTRCYISWIR